MLNFSRACHHALKALLYLSRNRDVPFVKIKDIAEETNIPPNFLSKIVQVLGNHGIIDSQLGPRGGVRLSAKSKDLSVADVVVAIDGKMDLNQCVLFGYKRCPELETCLIQKECKTLRWKIWDRLKNMKLNRM